MKLSTKFALIEDLNGGKCYVTKTEMKAFSIYLVHFILDSICLKYDKWY